MHSMLVRCFENVERTLKKLDTEIQNRSKIILSFKISAKSRRRSPSCCRVLQVIEAGWCGDDVYKLNELEFFDCVAKAQRI